jgi:hypothetical protein
MESKEYLGKIIIEENINTVNENKLSGTFVINVPMPFEHYYGMFTTIDKPASIIFITKSANSFEKILRVTNRINNKYNLDLDGAKCEVTIGSRKLNGIRVKGIFKFSKIAQIQNYYHEVGYEFAKSEKFMDIQALIRINRFFYLTELKNGIYQSQKYSPMFYLEIPRYMSWDEFKTITIEIKQNISENIDIAKGIFYRKHGITEMLRIIKPMATVELLEMIQQKYIDKLQ